MSGVALAKTGSQNKGLKKFRPCCRFYRHRFTRHTYGGFTPGKAGAATANQDIMLRIFQNFEQTAVQLNPIVLIGPGLAIVLVGLFIWLGGLGFRRLLVAVAGAVSGGICVFFITGRNIIAAIILAGVAAVIAIIFERLFITILAAALAAVFGFAVLAWPYIENSQEVIPMNPGRMSVQGPALSIRESIEKVKAYIADVSEKIKQACSQMPVYRWLILLVLVVTLMVVGFFLWRLASALCCSALGTTLIFAGMILLLLYKGSVPISSIYSKPLFYGAVFAAMTVFGTMEQLLLCQRAKRESIRKKGANKDKEGPKETTQGWRTT